MQVVLERVNSHVEISVADTGNGIKPEFLPHVFERFRQADASTTRSTAGSGSGLSIVKHSSSCTAAPCACSSPGEGQGATFTVHLPLTVVHRNGDAGERLHPTTPSATRHDFIAAELAGLKVLVVDDEADARELIKRVLEDCARRGAHRRHAPTRRCALVEARAAATCWSATSACRTRTATSC